MPKEKAQGLGDTAEMVFKTFGIDKVVKSVIGEDCGCGARKEKLNTMFDYNKKERCMTTEQATAYEAFLNRPDQLMLTGDQVEVLTDLYNTIFIANVKPCKGCSAVMLKSRIERVHSVYEKYLTLKEDEKINTNTNTNTNGESKKESSGGDPGSEPTKKSAPKAKSKRGTGKKRNTPRTKRV